MSNILFLMIDLFLNEKHIYEDEDYAELVENLEM